MYQKLSSLYCKKCSEVFNDESELADHIMGEHSPEEKSVNLTCEKCFGIEFTNKEDLLQHMLTNHIKTVSRGELENNDEKMIKSTFDTDSSKEGSASLNPKIDQSSQTQSLDDANGKYY